MFEKNASKNKFKKKVPKKSKNGDFSFFFCSKQLFLKNVEKSLELFFYKKNPFFNKSGKI